MQPFTSNVCAVGQASRCTPYKSGCKQKAGSSRFTAATNSQGINHSVSMLSPVIPTPHNSAMVMQIPSPENRSISPFSTSPSREFRGIKLFRAISRKLARKSQDDLNFGEDVDSRSSSTDSCSSTSAGHSPKPKKSSGCRSASPQRMSSSSSDAGSDTQSVKHRHSTSVESFRKVFQNLTVSSSSRSQSCSSSKETKIKCAKKTTSPKRILRPPVTYIYVKGLSGLPTQRVPRPQPRVCFKGACGYSIQHMGSLNR